MKGHLDYHRRLTEVLEAVGVKVSPRSKDVSTNDLEAAIEEVPAEETEANADRSREKATEAEKNANAAVEAAKPSSTGAMEKENVKFEL